MTCESPKHALQLASAAAACIAIMQTRGFPCENHHPCEIIQIFFSLRLVLVPLTLRRVQHLLNRSNLESTSRSSCSLLYHSSNMAAVRAPPKPWERAGAASTASASVPSVINASSPSSAMSPATAGNQTGSSSTAPAVPDRPSTMTTGQWIRFVRVWQDESITYSRVSGCAGIYSRHSRILRSTSNRWSCKWQTGHGARDREITLQDTAHAIVPRLHYTTQGCCTMTVSFSVQATLEKTTS